MPARHHSRLSALQAQAARPEGQLDRILETLELVTKQMAVAVSHCSRDFRYVWVNQEYANWLQLRLDEIVGRPIVDVLGKEAFEALRHHFEQVLAGEKVYYEQKTNFRGIGQRWTSATYTPTLDADGVANGWVAVVIDITERKSAEAALRESEERFRLVANTAPVMIWMSGIDKLCTYFNQPWLEFAGRSLKEELGNGWAEGIHPEDLEECLKTCTKAFDSREPFRMQYRLRRHDGEYRWIIDHGVPRFSADGSFAGYIGSCIDITERKLAEETLSTVSQKLIEAQEDERTRIARELHDDVGQRLVLLAWHLGSSNGNLRKQVVDLANDVHALSHKLHSPKLDYLGLAAAASGFCGELSDRQRVEIEFHSENIPKELPKEISLCLFRVLQEALQNAIKHSGSQQFQVSLRSGASEIELTVRDSGIGFETDEAIKGRGLGLTSMQERLKLVNGQLSIDSKPQRGTTIQARVPLSPRMKSAGANPQE